MACLGRVRMKSGETVLVLRALIARGVLAALLDLVGGAGAARDSSAQTWSEMPVEHASRGHQMNGPSDGAFHHRFRCGENGRKGSIGHDWRSLRFWTALHLTSAVRLCRRCRRGHQYFSVRITQSASRKAKYLPPISDGYGALPRRTGAT
jgi:hypothetical protein